MRRFSAGGSLVLDQAPGSSNVNRWALSDHEGTIRDVVSDAGTKLEHRKYDSFGQLVSVVDSGGIAIDPKNMLTAYSYTNQRYDAWTGLYDYHARWYDAANGRFISQDPLGFGSGDDNLYRYVGNNPLTYTDPTGLCNQNVYNSIAGSLANINIGNSTELWNSFVPSVDYRSIVGDPSSAYYKQWTPSFPSAWDDQDLLPEMADYVGSTIGSLLGGVAESFESVLSAFEGVAYAPGPTTNTSYYQAVHDQQANKGAAIVASMIVPASVGGVVVKGLSRFVSPNWLNAVSGTALGTLSGMTYESTYQIATGEYSAENFLKTTLLTGATGGGVGLVTRSPLASRTPYGYYDDVVAASKVAVGEGSAPMTGYTWNQVLQPRYGAANVEWAAPKIASDPLTLGVLRTPAGEFELASGWNGYGGLMPEGARGFNIVTRTHVEGQAAALMQRQGISEGILYINNPEMCGSCTKFLPRMLQPGRTLQVVLPDGTVVPVVGGFK